MAATDLTPDSAMPLDPTAGRLEPYFARASGWLDTAGQWSPASETERQALRRAALPCTVVVLREHGERIPAERLLKGAEPPSGLLVASQQYTVPHWHVRLYADETMAREHVKRLMHAKLERSRAGVRLYGGVEFEERGRAEWRQAWLVTPSPARAREILLEMLEREGGTL